MKETNMLPVMPYSIGRIELLLGLTGGSMRYYIKQGLLPQPDVKYGKQLRYSAEAQALLLHAWKAMRKVAE